MFQRSVIEFLDLPNDDIDMEMEEEFYFEGSDNEVSDLERFVRITELNNKNN